MKLGQIVCENSNFILKEHSKAFLLTIVLETLMFIALIIYDHVLGFIIRVEKMYICWFVHDTTKD